MGNILKRNTLIAITFAFILTIISFQPVSAAIVQPNDFYDTSPKYVEITKQFPFKKGEINNPPLTYFYITYFPAGRFSGTLQLKNPWVTITHSDGSGYHEVTYTGYVYFRPNGP